MAVYFGLRFGDDTIGGLGNRGCFGSLSNLKGFTTYDLSGTEVSSYKSHGATAIHYRPVYNYGVVPPYVKMFWEWVLETPLFKAAITDNNLLDEDVKPGELFVDVSTGVNPHHMLNTLSVVRAPYVHVGNILAWCNMVQAGVDPDKAFVLCWLFQSYGTGLLFVSYDYSSEHSILYPHRLNKELIKLAADNLQETSLPCYVDGHNEAYSSAGGYRRDGDAPVARWLVDNHYDSGDRLVEGTLLRGILLNKKVIVLDTADGKDYNPQYDTTKAFLNTFDEEHVEALKNIFQ